MINLDPLQFGDICDLLERIGSDISEKLQDIAGHLEGIHETLIGMEAQSATEEEDE